MHSHVDLEEGLIAENRPEMQPNLISISRVGDSHARMKTPSIGKKSKGRMFSE
jgi:hypothetical protein